MMSTDGTGHGVALPVAGDAESGASDATHWSALLAGLVGCGVPLVGGLLAGWTASYAAGYSLVAALYLLLTQAHRMPLLSRLAGSIAAYLVVMGLTGLVLQRLSSDPYIQPIVFTVPLVHAALCFSPGRTAAIAVAYLLLMGLGLWWSGIRAPEIFLYPLASYGALMGFMVAFTRMSANEAAARQRADLLATDLARERDYLHGLASENARLYEQAQLSATLAERNRIARELHDTIAQGLTAVTMQIEAAQRSFERDPARARARLARAYDLSRATLDDVRRSVWTLASPLVDGGTLAGAIEDVAARFTERTGIPVRYTHDSAPPALKHVAATQALRIVQEALQNVEKHAHATSVVVESRIAGAEIHISIRDDGSGFDPGDLPLTVEGDGRGFGLHGMKERARLAGGTVTVESAPGSGTCVTLIIPTHEP